MSALTERHVQAIWYDAALRPGRLYTRRGHEVSVITPGVWNLGAGPDFKNAVLEVGRERRRIVGDVEVHLCPSDWDFHHHGTDPRYRNVIAHVTWGCGPDPASLPVGAISIWLGRFFNGDPSFSPDAIDLMAYPYARLPDGERPCQKHIGANPDIARSVLLAAGRHRLRMKARRLSGRLGEVAAIARQAQSGVDAPRRQVFYEEVMTALGYSRNSEQFRRIASRIPIADLPNDTDAARTALLAAGSFETWDRGGSRPSNTPEIRLGKAAEVFTETHIMALAEASHFSRQDCKLMIHSMSVNCGPVKRRLPDVHRCMGRGRAAAILANVVVPWAIAEGKLDQAPDWLPPEDISDPVRLAAFRMFGRDHNPAAFYATNGLLIQGLIQIHRDYCLQMHPDCDDCTLIKGGYDDRMQTER